MTAPVDLGLRFTGASSDVAPEGITGHYGGPSPWRVADRSDGDRFAASTDHGRCGSIVRAWHDFHLSKGWFGLAYTAAVCPHGAVFEGRGPGRRTGANGTADGNRRSYAVVYVAGVGDPLTDAAKLAFHAEETRLGVPLRWDHSDWRPTACAGDAFRFWQAAGFPAATGQPTNKPGDGEPADRPSQPAPATSGGRVVVNVSLPVLRRGSHGQHVASLQSQLNVKSAQGLQVDGAFGPRTDQAVRNFQTFFRLRADGVAGGQTWGLLLTIPF